tara:strand:+ start:78 stop:386 length:309 start_codon:yes stop_codon:yes gene_type:complete
MSNALSEEKKQKALARRRLGWPRWRVEASTGVRRTTASGYLKAAGTLEGNRSPTRYLVPGYFSLGAMSGAGSQLMMGAAIALLFLPETRRRELEDISQDQRG